MPYPSQTNRDAILDTVRGLIEENGFEALSMAKVANALNITAPALYHHFENKTALLRAINTQTMHALIASMDVEIDADAPPQDRLFLKALAYRDYALAHPTTYGLLFGTSNPDAQADAAESEQLALPLQAEMAELSGEKSALPALRGLLALLHGFVSLELAGQFRRGGSLDEAFAQGLAVYLAGWTVNPPADLLPNV